MGVDDSTILINNKKIQTKLLNRGLLVILSPNYFGKTYVIDKNNNIIGRNSICDFEINDPKVSKEHCKIEIDQDNKFYIEDLKSMNDTFVNDKIIKKKKHLYYGDKITIGDTIIRFYFEEKFENR